MTEHYRDTDAALAKWDDLNPKLATARLTDAGLHRQFHTMRLTLSYVERALTEEGIDRDTRIRVINTALFGGPDPDALVDRVNALQSEIERRVAARRDAGSLNDTERD